jgi:hypothetical protein
MLFCNRKTTYFNPPELLEGIYSVLYHIFNFEPFQLITMCSLVREYLVLLTAKFAKISCTHYMSKCGTSSHITHIVTVNQNVLSNSESYCMLAALCKYH